MKYLQQLIAIIKHVTVPSGRVRVCDPQTIVNRPRFSYQCIETNLWPHCWRERNQFLEVDSAVDFDFLFWSQSRTTE